jgi:hypothetical protein
MKLYDLSSIPHEERAVFLAIEYCLRELPLTIKIQGCEERKELTAHILSRAVSETFPMLTSVDGIFLNKYDHSWVTTPSGRIIEVRPVKVLSGPYLIDVTSMDDERVRFSYRVLSEMEARRRYGNRSEDLEFNLVLFAVTRMTKRLARAYNSRVMGVKNTIGLRRKKRVTTLAG